MSTKMFANGIRTHARRATPTRDSSLEVAAILKRRLFRVYYKVLTFSEVEILSYFELKLLTVSNNIWRIQN